MSAPATTSTARSPFSSEKGLVVAAAEEPGRVYDADYYLRGQETGKSLYKDYRWLPELTLPMCHWIVQHLGIRRDETILDFGCARGYVVKALRLMGYEARGIDCSAWAIDNADPSAAQFVEHRTDVPGDFDWILAKDVLEHIPEPHLGTVVCDLLNSASRGVFIVVPLASAVGEPYVVPEYERDVTHVQRLTLGQWVEMLRGYGYVIESGYRMPGIKDNYSQWERGNGFLVARRERT